MGHLIDGFWRDQWYDTAAHGGEFRREESAFRDWIGADGGTGFRIGHGRVHDRG